MSIDVCPDFLPGRRAFFSYFFQQQAQTPAQTMTRQKHPYTFFIRGPFATSSHSRNPFVQLNI